MLVFSRRMLLNLLFLANACLQKEARLQRAGWDDSRRKVDTDKHHEAPLLYPFNLPQASILIVQGQVGQFIRFSTTFYMKFRFGGIFDHEII